MIQVKPRALDPGMPASGSGPDYDLQACALKSRRASKLPAAALLAEFASTLACDRGTTVDLLIQMGEIEARKLFVSKACSDMYAYCTEVLHMSESTAWRRVRAARAAREHPAILPLVADGKLHLSAVALLAPHLTRSNAGSLLTEATHRSKSQVELILARRFPKPDVPESVRVLADPSAAASRAAQVVANIAARLSPVTVVPTTSDEVARSAGPPQEGAQSIALHQMMSQVVAAAAASNDPESAPESLLARITDAVTQTIATAANSVAPGVESQHDSRARVTPHSAGRYAWQLTADQHMQDLLEEARELIGHAGPRDLAAVLKRGLTLLVETLRKSKCAETSRPHTPSGSAIGRHVPAAAVRAVWERDEHQCTFRSEDGRRCSARSDLEIDQVIPFARGGKTTLENLRLLCRTHNQYEAERVYGESHMREQRAAAQARAEKTKAARPERTRSARELTAVQMSERLGPPSRLPSQGVLRRERRCGSCLPRTPLGYSNSVSTPLRPRRVPAARR